MKKSSEIKPSDPIYTLGITSKLSGTPAHSIRQYIDKGLIIPFTTETKRHLFSQSDIARIKYIKRCLQEEGLNIAGLKAVFSLIPCWSIKSCTLKERRKCKAYKSTSVPCWEATKKSELCKNNNCRECSVYQIYENHGDLKSLIKELIK